MNGDRVRGTTTCSPIVAAIAMVTLVTTAGAGAIVGATVVVTAWTTVVAHGLLRRAIVLSPARRV